MAWVLGLGIFAFLLFKFPAFRTGTLIVGGLGALLIVGEIYSEQSNQKAAKALIPKAQLDLNNIRLANSYSSYTLTGEVRNNSPHELTSIRLAVTVFDCPSMSIASDCTTIGEDKDVYVSLDIPPQQVRAITSAYVTLRDMPPIKKNFLWSYSVIETTGKN